MDGLAGRTRAVPASDLDRRDANRRDLNKAKRRDAILDAAVRCSASGPPTR